MKYISYIRYALIAISLIIVGVGLNSGNVDAMLRWTEALLCVTGVVLIVLSAFTMAQDPKSAGRSMVGLLIILAVLGISYAMADTTPIVTPVAIFDNKADLVIADTGLYATYFALILSIGSIVVTEAYNLIKK